MRAKTNAERQQTYWERKRQAGYRRLVLWVPADDLDAIVSILEHRSAARSAQHDVDAVDEKT